MQYTRLGKSDLLVSRICMGCGMGLAIRQRVSIAGRWTNSQPGHHPPRSGTGHQFYDTAIAYQNGSSERYVGRRCGDGKTRGGGAGHPSFCHEPLPRLPRISGKQAIARSLDQSLRNLGMDYIDLYIYHIWDYNTPVIDVLEALHTAVTAGKVRAIGISICYARQLAKANALAEREGLTSFVSVQSHYNLIMREDERELFGLCARGIAMTPIARWPAAVSPLEGHTRGERWKMIMPGQIRRHSRAGSDHYCPRR